MIPAAGLAAGGCTAGGRTIGEHVDDTWISTKTRLHLMTYQGRRHSRIQTEVVRGTVTLRGEVTTEEERAEAEKAVREIVGVTDVVNLLEVAPPDTAPRRPSTTAY